MFAGRKEEACDFELKGKKQRKFDNKGPLSLACCGWFVCADPRRMPPLTCIQGTFACFGAARRFYGHHMHIRLASSCKSHGPSPPTLAGILLFRPESRADIPESSLQPDVVPVHCMNIKSCVTRKRRFCSGLCVFGLVEALQILEGGDGEERRCIRWR